ncbi:MAG: class I SAM-dependent methyltransferase [Promethearchaeota archaeon]
MNEYWKKDSWKIETQKALPYLATPIDVIESIFKFLNEKNLIAKGQRLVDLGAGDGRVIIYASEFYKLISLGLEINLNLIKSAESEIKRKDLSDLCKIMEMDLFNYDISDMDIVFCFFLPSNHVYCSHMIEIVKSGGIVINIKWDLKKFKKYWKKSFKIKTNEQFPAYVYIKK